MQYSCVLDIMECGIVVWISTWWAVVIPSPQELYKEIAILSPFDVLIITTADKSEKAYFRAIAGIYSASTNLITVKPAYVCRIMVCEVSWKTVISPCTWPPNDGATSTLYIRKKAHWGTSNFNSMSQRFAYHVFLHTTAMGINKSEQCYLVFWLSDINVAHFALSLSSPRYHSDGKKQTLVVSWFLS